MAQKPSFRRAFWDSNLDSYFLASVKGAVLGLSGFIVSTLGMIVGNDVLMDEGQQGSAVSDAQVARYEAEIKELKSREKVLQSFELLSDQEGTGQAVKSVAEGLVTPAMQVALKEKAAQGRSAFNQSVQALSYKMISDKNMSEKGFDQVSTSMIKQLDAPVPVYLADNKDQGSVSGWKLRECQAALPSTATGDDISMCSREKTTETLYTGLAVGVGAGISLMFVGPLLGYRRQRKNYKNDLLSEAAWKKRREEMDKAEAEASDRGSKGKQVQQPVAAASQTSRRNLRF